MTKTYKNSMALILFACVPLAACASANQSFIDQGRESDVMKAQLAATSTSKATMSSHEGEKIYANYLDATGKPIRPTSSMESSTK